jgi:hypothetical protein
MNRSRFVSGVAVALLSVPGSWPAAAEPRAAESPAYRFVLAGNPPGAKAEGDEADCVAEPQRIEPPSPPITAAQYEATVSKCLGYADAPAAAPPDPAPKP